MTNTNLVRAASRVTRAILLAVCIMGVVGIALLALMDGESVRLAAARWLSGVLHADVTYDSIRISYSMGVDIRGLAVESWPTAGSSFHAKRLTIRPDWRELIGGTLRFSSVSVDGWTGALFTPGLPASRDTVESESAMPDVEVVDITLRNGSLLVYGAWGVRSLTVNHLEGLARLSPAESSVRVRSLRFVVGSGVEAHAEASLWRLGDGPWDAQVSVSSDAGVLTGTASEADGGWTWDIAAQAVDITRWADALALGGDDLSGIADIEASGQGLAARGRIDVRNPRWRSWEAEALGASLQFQSGTIVARRLQLLHRNGGIAGAARFSMQEDGWVAEANIVADSVGIPLPGHPGGTVVVSGTAEARGSLSGDTRSISATLRDAEFTWRTLWVGGVNARLTWAGDDLTLDQVTIEHGSLRGVIDGRLSASAIHLRHDLWVSLRPSLAPFISEPVMGDAHVRGDLIGFLPDVSWSGGLEAYHMEVGGATAATGQFLGSVSAEDGSWHLTGTAGLGALRTEGTLLLIGARANVDADSDRIKVTSLLALRPGGVLVSSAGEWTGRAGRLTHLNALSDRWALAVLGGVAVTRGEDGVRVPALTVATSGGGLLEALDLLLTPSVSDGLILVRHLPVDAVARLGGFPGPFAGRCYGAVRAGATTQAWASVKGLQRLPAMARFPVDINLQLSRSPSRITVHSLEVIQDDLRVLGSGMLDSTGAIHAEVESDHSPLGRVLVLSDELLNAGLRPILDSRSGTISARISVEGTTGRPELSGSIEVDGTAEIIVKPVRTTFKSVRGSARLEGHTIIIDEVTGRSGKGSARLQGKLELPGLVLDAATFDIDGRLQEFRLVPGIYGIYDADLSLAKRGMGIALDGEVRLTEGLIDLPSIPIEPVPSTEAGLDDQWFLSIVADRGVWVRDRFLNAEVAGQVAVEKEHGVISMQGDLQVLRGTYLYLGRKFLLQQGKVSFMGGPLITPEVDVSATTVIRSEQRDGTDITLTLTVTGKVDDPVLRVTADDADYSEEQIKTMLLFNLTPEDILALWQGDAFAKEAAGAVEEFLAGEIARVLRAETGLDELEVSPNLLSSEDRDLYVRLGKYLTPELFISVAKGLRSFGFDEVRVEYLLRTLARRIGLGKNADLKLVGERMQDEYSRTNYQVQMKLKYKF